MNLIKRTEVLKYWVAEGCIFHNFSNSHLPYEVGNLAIQISSAFMHVPKYLIKKNQNINIKFETFFWHFTAEG